MQILYKNLIIHAWWSYKYDTSTYIIVKHKILIVILHNFCQCKNKLANSTDSYLWSDLISVVSELFWTKCSQNTSQRNPTSQPFLLISVTCSAKQYDYHLIKQVLILTIRNKSFIKHKKLFKWYIIHSISSFSLIQIYFKKM